MLLSYLSYFPELNVCDTTLISLQFFTIDIIVVYLFMQIHLNEKSTLLTNKFPEIPLSQFTDFTFLISEIYDICFIKIYCQLKHS